MVGVMGLETKGLLVIGNYGDLLSVVGLLPAQGPIIILFY